MNYIMILYYYYYIITLLHSKPHNAFTIVFEQIYYFIVELHLQYCIADSSPKTPFFSMT